MQSTYLILSKMIDIFSSTVRVPFRKRQVASLTGNPRLSLLTTETSFDLMRYSRVSFESAHRALPHHQQWQMQIQPKHICQWQSVPVRKTLKLLTCPRHTTDKMIALF